MRFLKSENHRSFHGFSLMEIVVTITVLAILVALVFVKISDYNRRATSISCMTNLRKIGAAVFLYMSENEQNIPMYANTAPKGWMEYIAPYANIEVDSSEEVELFRCPEVQRFMPVQPRSYRWNTASAEPGKPVFTNLRLMGDVINISIVRYPEKHAMIMDILYTGTSKFKMWANNNLIWGRNYDVDQFPPGSNKGYIRPHYDEKAMNILFYDGHVEAVEYPFRTSIYYYDID